MPKTINPIRKALLKKALIKNKGKNVESSMIEAGYTPAYASKTGANKVVKVIQQEISEDILKKINVDYVLSELERIKGLAEADGDFSTATRNMELLGKYLAMFTDKTINKTAITIEDEEKSILDKYIGRGVTKLASG